MSKRQTDLNESLHKAILENNVNQVKDLIEAGADVNVKVNSGESLMDITLFKFVDDLALLAGLLYAMGELPSFDEALKIENIQVIKALIGAGIDVDDKVLKVLPKCLSLAITTTDKILAGREIDKESDYFIDWHSAVNRLSALSKINQLSMEQKKLKNQEYKKLYSIGDEKYNNFIEMFFDAVCFPEAVGDRLYNTKMKLLASLMDISDEPLFAVLVQNTRNIWNDLESDHLLKNTIAFYEKDPHLKDIISRFNSPLLSTKEKEANKYELIKSGKDYIETIFKATIHGKEKLDITQENKDNVQDILSCLLNDFILNQIDYFELKAFMEKIEEITFSSDETISEVDSVIINEEGEKGLPDQSSEVVGSADEDIVEL